MAGVMLLFLTMAVRRNHANDDDPGGPGRYLVWVLHDEKYLLSIELLLSFFTNPLGGGRAIKAAAPVWVCDDNIII